MHATRQTIERSSAHEFLTRLAVRGVDIVFANAGTDFAPLIEAMSWRAGEQQPGYPRFVIVPHENLAMAMAYGYYRATGKLAAVMVHVSVGTANTVCQLINMHRDQVPVILCAGRSPATEQGHIASRDTMIHWGQEMLDQGGMVREFVKWDYELRAGQPVAALVDRGVDIAMSQPRGPVYLSLPRETLADPAAPTRVPLRRHDNFESSPSPAAIEAIADIIAEAEFPLILTCSLGRSPEEAGILSKLAEDHALPTVQVWASDAALTHDHSMNLGYGERLQLLLDKADAILLVRAPIPWITSQNQPRADAQIIQVDADPHRLTFPFAEREAQLTVAADPAEALRLLHQKLGPRRPYESRREFAATFRREAADMRAAESEAGRNQRPIHSAWLSECVNGVRSPDAILVNELGMRMAHWETRNPREYIGTTLGGGLGLGLGAAVGAKIGAPGKDVIAVVGDGSYMFGNPVPYHYVQRSERAPVLTIVANNHSWLAVKQSTLAVYPEGYAAALDEMPLQSLSPSPAFEKVAESCGGFGMAVDDPERLPEALETAMAKVRAGIPALLNVHTMSR
jgi:acetolactate synthase-1/2/3 large subunit